MKEEGVEKIGELLQKLDIQCEFRVTELNEKFTKIQLHNFKDKFPILQANKLLRDQAFREKACMDNCPIILWSVFIRRCEQVCPRNSLIPPEEEKWT